MSFPHKEVVKVAITGAAGQIAYSLLPMIARGLMFGAHQKVILSLLDIEPAKEVLSGVKMEMEDSAYPLLVDTIITTDPREAFAGADACVMCGAFPRKDGMERKDLLAINAKIFTEQGRIIGEVAEAHCRILVVGNPANTNALLLSTAAKTRIDPRNVTALTRLDMNRAVTQTALKTNVAVADVNGVIIWGNHSATQVPDVEHATASGKPVREVAQDDDYFYGPFVATIQQRGAAVIKARKLSSATSAAKAITDHMHDWIVGTKAGTHVAMSVLSDGNPYGVPPGLVYSFPVTSVAGQWSFVGGLPISDKIRALMQKSTEELLSERELAGL